MTPSDLAKRITDTLFERNYEPGNPIPQLLGADLVDPNRRGIENVILEVLRSIAIAQPMVRPLDAGELAKLDLRPGPIEYVPSVNEELLTACRYAHEQLRNGGTFPIAGETWKKLDRALASLDPSAAAGFTDAERLDFLEKDIEEDPLLLHNLPFGTPQHGFRGLGLKNTGRSLRQALDDLMVVSKPCVVPWPFPTKSKP